ncbi:DUF397 domain-containing protein [Nocardiopsis salina]|uniref:DUF397 domain-containing protein n=1 Tax=Nocardiopsis salina TaxID=245836 RepID=UPI00034730B0
MITPEFRKSSLSGAGQNCVEAKRLGDPGPPRREQVPRPGVGIGVRDSQHPHEGHLSFPGPEWSALLAGLRAPE